jgi:hypothetical protein
MAIADQRAADLRDQGIGAYVYGKEEIVGGLNCFFLLVDEPEVYGLPSKPELPSKNVAEGFGLSALTAALVAAGSVVAFRKDRMDGMGDDGEPRPATEPPAPSGAGEPPGGLTMYMAAVEAANEVARARRLEAQGRSGGGCGSGACGCHA